MSTVFKPSEAPYTAALNPAGPAPKIAKSYSVRDGVLNHPSFSTTWRIVGDSIRSPSGKMQMGKRRSLRPLTCAFSRASASLVNSVQMKGTLLRCRKSRRAYPLGERCTPINLKGSCCSFNPFASVIAFPDRVKTWRAWAAFARHYLRTVEDIGVNFGDNGSAASTGSEIDI